MKNAFEELLGSEVLSEEVKTTLSEAWESKLTEARQEIKAELREEFAQRYEHDKQTIVESMDQMLTDAIQAELTEFQSDKQKMIEATVAYKQGIQEHAKVLDKFVLENMAKEMKELYADKKLQEQNFKKLENFVLKQLTTELNEFYQDKRALVEQKVKLVREGKKIIAETRHQFIKRAAEKIEKLVESTVRTEMTSLREDIKQARENNFGRKIFETFATEFMTSYLAEGTELAKMKKKLEESNQMIQQQREQLSEATDAVNLVESKIKVVEGRALREKTMNELLSPLNKDQREIMSDLLESVQTDNLKVAYQKYLPTVLKENKKVDKNESKVNLVESTGKREITGNKPSLNEANTSDKNDLVYIRKLAGLE